MPQRWLCRWLNGVCACAAHPDDPEWPFTPARIDACAADFMHYAQLVEQVAAGLCVACGCMLDHGSHLRSGLDNLHEVRCAKHWRAGGQQVGAVSLSDLAAQNSPAFASPDLARLLARSMRRT